MAKKLDKPTQEHYDFLRKHHIGEKKAVKMAKAMTLMDKKDKD